MAARAGKGKSFTNPQKKDSNTMFILAPKKTFTAPVVAQVPADGGRTQRVTFSVIFKAPSKQEVDALLDRVRQRARANQEAVESGGTRSINSDRELLDEVLVGFGDDLKHPDGTAVEFTPENVDALCSIWPMESAIAKSFIDNYIGAAQKN